MKIAFPSDAHHPFQDDRAIELALRIVSDYQPDVLITGNDGSDFYNISHFDRNPARKINLQDEIDSWVRTQRMWNDAAPTAYKPFIIGNHEDRLRRYLWKNQEMAGLRALTLPNLLQLSELGIHWDEAENGNLEFQVDDVVVFKHGSIVRKNSAYTARAELEREYYAVSTITGHTHRGGSYFVRTRFGVKQAHEGFCLCNLDPEYAINPDWQQGILLAEVINGNLTVEPIPFYDHNGKKSAVWRGKEYTI